MLRFMLLSISSLLVVTTAYAQDSDPTATVDREISSIASNVTSDGFRQSGNTQYLDINGDEEQTIDVYLNGSTEYAIWGACDGDCGDVDFVLSDVYGNEIDSDLLEDDRPVVRSNGLNGTYRLTVKMYDCSYDPCRVGIATYTKPGSNGGNTTPNTAFGGGSTGGGNAADSPRGLVDQQLLSLSSHVIDQGYVRFRENNYLWLNDSETQTFEVQLTSGSNYQIWGVCDGDCSDLDMTLLDAYGNVVDEDVLDDSRPLLDPSGIAAGPYTVSVKMYECSVEPCLVGVNFFSR